MFDRLPYSISVAEAAIDLENYIDGRSTDLRSVRDLTEILKQHQLKDTDSIDAHLFDTFYMPLWKAMIRTFGEDSGKKLIYASELVSETGSLILKLDNIETNPDPGTLKEVVTLLINYSKELVILEQETYKRRLVA